MGSYKIIGLLMGGMFITTLVLILTGQTFPSADIYNPFVSTVNDTSNTYPTSATFSVVYGSLTGFLVVVGVIGAVAIGASILVLGSGLNESGAKTVYQIIWFTALWSMLSLLPAPYLFVAGIWGIAIYFGITFVYAYCCISVLGESEST